MPLSNEYVRLPLDRIKVMRDARQRKEIEIDSLKSSISARGVMNPIIVQRDGTLVAGERRLEASRALGLPDIPVRFAEDLTPLEAQIIELEENLKRKDLHWAESVLSINSIHRLYCTATPGWTYDRTAEALGLNRNYVQKVSRVAIAIESERKTGDGKSPTAECDSWRQAYEKLVRLKQRASADALEIMLTGEPDDEEGEMPAQGVETALAGVNSEDQSSNRPTGIGELPKIQIPSIRLFAPNPQRAPSNAAPKPKPEEILQADFVEWASSYAGPKFNFIHCDFPYGVNVFKGRMERTARVAGFEYDDGPEVFDKLVDALADNAKHLISGSAHLMFWTSAKADRVGELLGRFAQRLPMFEFWPFPLIWHKSDNAGQFPNPDMGPRHTYELALFGTAGGRKVVQMVADSFSARTNNSIHPSAKPLDVLGHFFRMLVDDSTRMLDPTCGSGTALVAADRLGAAQVLGIERDGPMVQSARMALKSDRIMRTQEKERKTDL